MVYEGVKNCVKFTLGKIMKTPIKIYTKSVEVAKCLRPVRTLSSKYAIDAETQRQKESQHYKKAA